MSVSSLNENTNEKNLNEKRRNYGIRNASLVTREKSATLRKMTLDCGLGNLLLRALRSSSFTTFYCPATFVVATFGSGLFHLTTSQDNATHNFVTEKQKKKKNRRSPYTRNKMKKSNCRDAK